MAASTVECIELPVKLIAYQFKGVFEKQDTPLFVAKAFDITSLKFVEYHPDDDRHEKGYYYLIRNKQTDANEKIHDRDWFVQYMDKVVIVTEVDFIKNYIQLSDQFRIMLGTILI